MFFIVFHFADTIQGTQVRAYQAAIDSYGKRSDWQIAYDIDEYPYSSVDQKRGFLRRKVWELSSTEADVSELSLQNFVFLGKTCWGEERVIERLLRRTPIKANHLDKPIYRPMHATAAVHHNSLHTGHSKDVDPIQLRTNHYW